MPNIAESFNLALQHHQAGKLEVAEQLYQQILQADPSHADSHHLLGVVAYQRGRYGVAAASISHALSLNPWAAIYHSNLGVVYDAAGKLEDALASFQQALQLQPYSAEAYNAVGNTLRALGRYPEAEAHCTKALQLRAGFPEAHNNLGNALYLQGKLDEALVHYQQALALKPDYADAHAHIGLVLADKGRWDEAIERYHQALQLNPSHAEAHNNLAISLLKKDKLEEAAANCRRALELRPGFAGAHNNLSIALRRLGQLDESAHHGREAIRLNPSFPEAHNSLATALLQQGQYNEALDHYHEAVRLKPHFADARWNRSLLRLQLGDFAQGWPEYEWRWRRPGSGLRHGEQRLWNGSDLTGKTILLCVEQGFGDTLHFIRYATLVKKRGCTVIVECQPALVRLLACAVGIDRVVAEGSPLPEFNVHAPLLNLPVLLQTTLDNVPAAVPYIHPDAGLVEHWRQELQVLDGYKVGICWQGSPTYGYDRLRSVPLTHFTRLAQIEGVRLISLQKGPGTEQLLGSCQLSAINHQPELGGDAFRAAPDQRAVYYFGSGLDEASGAFMDTAAIMKNLDLIITSDTAIPHLAGALGVPTWLALPLVPDWRWLLEREDSPWYPSMRLFRQIRHAHWDDVFERVANELSYYLDCSRSRQTSGGAARSLATSATFGNSLRDQP